MRLNEKEYEMEVTHIYIVQGTSPYDALCKAEDTDIVDIVDYKVIKEYELEE